MKKCQYIHLFFELIGVLVSIGHGNFVKLCCMGTRTQGSGTRTGYLGMEMVRTQTYPHVPWIVLSYRVLHKKKLGTFGQNGTAYLDFGYSYGTAGI